MGVYEVGCSKCHKSFMWFSSNINSLCPDCIENMGGGVYTIERKYKVIDKNLVGCYYFIGYNEAKTYEDAIKLLIEKGVPEDEIVYKAQYDYTVKDFK
jgi:hypothetical protein